MGQDTFDSEQVFYMLVTTILLVIVVIVPIIRWFEAKQAYLSTQFQFRQWKRNPFRNILEYASYEDELSDKYKTLLVFIPLTLGVFGVGTGIVIGLIAPLMFEASGSLQLFLVVIGAAFFFLGIGLLLASRYMEGGLAVGLMGFAMAFTLITNSLGVPVADFDELWNLLVVVSLIAASALLGIWIGDSSPPLAQALQPLDEATLAENTKTKRAVAAMMAIVLLMQFVVAAGDILKMIVGR